VLDKFTLTIELGNDGMQDPADVGHALDEIANELIERRFAVSGTVRDVNGNTVGRWEFS